MLITNSVKDNKRGWLCYVWKG